MPDRYTLLRKMSHVTDRWLQSKEKEMERFPAWLQAGLLGLAILLIGTIGVLALNGQLRLSSLQPTWELTILHTNDVLGYTAPCG